MNEESVKSNNKCLKCFERACNIFVTTILVGQFYNTSKRAVFRTETLPLEITFFVTYVLQILEIVLFVLLAKKKLFSFGCTALFFTTVLVICAFQVTVLAILEIPSVYFLFYEYGFLLLINFTIELMVQYNQFSLTRQRKKVITLFKRLTLVHPSPSLLEKECVICLNNLAPQIVALPCTSQMNHYFHLNCFRMWYERSHQCPICRGTEYEERVLHFSKSLSTQSIAPFSEDSTGI